MSIESFAGNGKHTSASRWPRRRERLSSPHRISASTRQTKQLRVGRRVDKRTGGCSKSHSSGIPDVKRRWLAPDRRRSWTKRTFMEAKRRCDNVVTRDTCPIRGDPYPIRPNDPLFALSCTMHRRRSSTLGTSGRSSLTPTELYYDF
jgi:hypothetical protein